MGLVHERSGISVKTNSRSSGLRPIQIDLWKVAGGPGFERLVCLD